MVGGSKRKSKFSDALPLKLDGETRLKRKFNGFAGYLNISNEKAEKTAFHHTHGRLHILTGLPYQESRGGGERLNKLSRGRIHVDIFGGKGAKALGKPRVGRGGGNSGRTESVEQKRSLHVHQGGKISFGVGGATRNR